MSAHVQEAPVARTFLRGMGVTMSLPCWTRWCPQDGAGADGGQAAGPARPLFHPARRGDEPVDAGHGGPLELSPTLSPLARTATRWWCSATWRTRMAGPQGPGDNGGDHTRCPAVFLNGVHPKRTDGADIQAASRSTRWRPPKIGQDTLLPSLELAIEDYSGWSARATSGSAAPT
jgi:hypothetical protein